MTILVCSVLHYHLPREFILLEKVFKVLRQFNSADQMLINPALKMDA